MPLSPSDKDHIRAYLWKVFTPVITIMTLVGGAFGYLIFDLARSQTFREASAGAVREAIQPLLTMSQTVGEQRGTLSVLNDQITRARSELDVESNKARAFTQQNVRDISQVLLSDASFRQGISAVPGQDIRDIQSQINALGFRGDRPSVAARTPERQPNGAPHNGNAVSAECPDRHFASGINIQYGGTCRGTCDADGGVVRFVTLVCRPL